MWWWRRRPHLLLHERIPSFAATSVTVIQSIIPPRTKHKYIAATPAPSVVQKPWSPKAHRGERASECRNFSSIKAPQTKSPLWTLLLWRQGLLLVSVTSTLSILEFKILLRMNPKAKLFPQLQLSSEWFHRPLSPPIYSLVSSSPHRYD